MSKSGSRIIKEEKTHEEVQKSVRRIGTAGTMRGERTDYIINNDGTMCPPCGRKKSYSPVSYHTPKCRKIKYKERKS